MKILNFCTYYGVAGGGVGLLLQHQSEQLVQWGHEIINVVLVNSETQSDKIPNLSFHQPKPINLYAIKDKDNQPIWKKTLWQLSDLYSLQSAYVIKNLIQTEKPDLIHIHKMRGFSGALWQVCSQLMPNKVIQTLHDYECISPIGTLEGQIGQWAKNEHWLLKPYQAVRRFQTKPIAWVTAPSQDTLKTVLNVNFFQQAKPRVIPNPHAWTSSQLAAREKAHSSQPQAFGSPFRFLYLSRLEPEKGIRELLEAFNQAYLKHPHAQLTVAGWGSLGEELKQVWGKHPAIHFVGRVEAKEKEKLLSEADVLVVPSTWAEAFGIVSVEAFAFGKPVIASNIGGLPEIITEGKTGWLVEAGSISKLQAKLGFVLQNPNLPSEMSAACFESSKKYAVDVIAKEYLRLYEEVLST